MDAKPVGTRVRRGEALALYPAKADASDGPLPIAPATGRIIAMASATVLGGREGRAALLETDADAAGATRAPEPIDLLQLNAALKLVPEQDVASAIDLLRRRGVWADRWTSPDLLAQLRGAPTHPIDVILCNGLDLDPVLPLQQAVLRSAALDVAGGLRALARATGARQVILAVAEDTPADGVKSLRIAADATSVRLYPLPDEYPLAHPSLLVRRTTGRRARPGTLPSEAGVLVLDAAAARAVGRALLLDEPMLEVPVGLYDRDGGAAHLLLGSVGTSIADLLSAIGVDARSGNDGGPTLFQNHVLRGLAARSDQVIAGGESVLFASRHHHLPEPAACLRCGWCVEACPARIHPAGLLEAAQQDDRDLARQFGLPSCIDCGICSYVCPSRLPLLSSIRRLRGDPEKSIHVATEDRAAR